jgi:hypothetical protein
MDKLSVMSYTLTARSSFVLFGLFREMERRCELMDTVKLA